MSSILLQQFVALLCIVDLEGDWVSKTKTLSAPVLGRAGEQQKQEFRSYKIDVQTMYVQVFPFPGTQRFPQVNDWKLSKQPAHLVNLHGALSCHLPHPLAELLLG